MITSSRRVQRNAGFTLMELMVAVAVSLGLVFGMLLRVMKIMGDNGDDGHA